MQQRLQTLGNTNRARWNIFSTEPEITFDQFCQRIGALGIDSNPQEIATIWRSVGIPPDSMQFADFVRFLQASTTFDSLICGTKDGALLFCSLSRGEVVRVVDLNGKAPRSVIITKSLGFVLLYADELVDGQLSHHIILYK